MLKKMQTRLRDEEIRLLKGDSAQRRRGGRRGLDKADGDDDGLFGRDEDDDDEDADLSLDDELDGKGNEESELLSGDNDLSEGEYRPHSLDDNDQEDDVEESDNEF